MSGIINFLKTLGVYASAGPDFRWGFNGHIRFKNTVNTDATTTALTWTTAYLLGGLLVRDPTGGTATDTTPTAVAIVKALGNGVVVGSCFDLFVKHTGSAGEDVTVAGGDSVTLSPTTIKVDGGEVLHLRFVITNVVTPAITVYSLGVQVLTSP